MKDIPPPILKRTEYYENDLPVHDVRKDIGPTTESQLDNLRHMKKRITNWYKNQDRGDRTLLKRQYFKLYEELDKEQRALRSAANRMAAGSEKNATHARARAIKDALRKSTPEDELKDWRLSQKANQLDNLSGVWIGKDYICEGRKIAEEVDFMNDRNAIVAIKRTGDACVPAGRITFAGTLLKNGIDCHLGTPERPASETKRGSVSVYSVNHVSACGVTFERK